MNKYEPTGFAAQIFKDRYAIHSKETFEQACKRVADYISGVEEGSKRDKYANKFLELLLTNKFSPGGRIWRGAGRKRGQLLNCFVLPAEDSREGWGDALRDVTIISGTGGGVGLNFSKIRPRGTPIRGTGGEATGAVSLMKMINSICNELREGGGRRSALMFCLNWDHPDLLEFLEVKLDKKELSNANISVCIDNAFLKLLQEDQEIIFKWQGEERGRIRAREVWDKIIANSLASGDPGLLNLGLANELNPISYVEPLMSTNPCGEIFMQPYDCCCLGAVVLSNHVTNRKVDWDMLEETVALSVRFLDNVLDQNCYPLPQIEETCQKNRRIGLGVMGLHDMLLKMGYKYSSNNAIQLVDELMEFIKKRAYDTSIELAIEKGPFHNCDPQKHSKTKFAKRCLTASLRRRIEQHGIRNCAILTIAPTGTTSIVSGCSSGVEPLFELVYKRNFNEHAKQHNKERESSNEIIIHPLVQEFIEKELSTRHFESAHDIDPNSHLAMQYVCQKHVDNAISKTINLPQDFSTNDLSDIMEKYIHDLKGITIYREGSKGNPPLISVSIEEAKKSLGTIHKRASVNDCPKGNCEIT